ncbi:MAG: HIT family protein [Sphaerochaetaceae bacterium]|jgi:histidine triad (HIT) family protein
METIFTKIINNEIPSVQLYNDEKVIVILDIAPTAKGHTLVISKTPYPSITDCPDDQLAHLMKIVKKVASVLREKLKADAVNVVINDGPAAGQEIAHLHIHVIPRYFNDHKKLTLPKEKYNEGEIETLGKLLSFI